MRSELAMRQPVPPRRASATPHAVEARGAREVRHSAASACSLFLRVLLVPPAIATAALSGVLFAILLPICGIATIAEAAAKGAWAFVRGTLSHFPR